MNSDEWFILTLGLIGAAHIVVPDVLHWWRWRHYRREMEVRRRGRHGFPVVYRSE